MLKDISGNISTDAILPGLPTERVKTFSYDKNRELVNFCRNIGLRRFELEHIKGDCLIQENGNYSITVKGKGGKVRNIPVTDKEVIERIKNTPPKELVWGKVNSHAPIHTFRDEYATKLYKSLEEILTQYHPQKDIFAVKIWRVKSLTNVQWLPYPNTSVIQDFQLLQVII